MYAQIGWVFFFFCPQIWQKKMIEYIPLKITIWKRQKLSSSFLLHVPGICIICNSHELSIGLE